MIVELSSDAIDNAIKQVLTKYGKANNLTCRQTYSDTYLSKVVTEERSWSFLWRHGKYDEVISDTKAITVGDWSHGVVTVESKNGLWDKMAAEVATDISKFLGSERVKLLLFDVSSVKLVPESSMFCGYCGQKSKPDSVNCQHCGAPLSFTQQEKEQQ